MKKWSFDNEDIDFDEHVNTSIPFYEETHKLISYLSTFFIKDHSIVYEIGCSTGTLLNRVNLYNNNSTVEYIGIEPSKKLTKIGLDKYGDKIKIINSTVQKETLKKSDLVFCLFMLQFISVGERSSILK